MHNQPREPQSYEDCQAKSIQDLGELHKEWTEAGVKAGGRVEKLIAHVA